ncbi:MAG: LacI family DNA-binding transcriptional regulator [Proteiniphilum sp.]|nr:LacI family DNA-binding transcriptional regulator [Proteiniphilum sp.]
MKVNTETCTPKLKDVAEKADVSLTTASMALSGKGRISEEVKTKVQQAANELGYQKNIQLKIKKELKRVGVLTFTDFEWVWTWKMVQVIFSELEHILLQNNCIITLIPVRSDAAYEEVLFNIQAWDIEAVISIHYGNRSLFKELEAADIPVVIVMNNNYQNEFNSISVDDFNGAYEGTKYLISLGHRQIAYVDYKIPFIPALVTDRYIGFHKAVSEFSLSYPDDHRITCDFNNMMDIRSKVCSLLEQEPKPTAIFALDDYLGVKILTILKECGIRVPEDMSLLTPGDVLDYHKPYIPKITTMSINFELMGRLAAELLLDKLNNPRKEISVLKVAQHLVIRDTCSSI